MIDPTRSRRSRCVLDPRWLAVQSAIFIRDAAPLIRTRLRGGGADAALVLGCVFSLLAVRGRLGAIPPVYVEHGTVLDIRHSAHRMTPGEALDRFMQALFAAVKIEIEEELVAQHGCEPVIERLITQRDATLARFTSEDD
jgi:hypothetical protein